MILLYATVFNGQASFKGQLCKLGAVETDCNDKTLHVLSKKNKKMIVNPILLIKQNKFGRIIEFMISRELHVSCLKHIY